MNTSTELLHSNNIQSPADQQNNATLTWNRDAIEKQGWYETIKTLAKRPDGLNQLEKIIKEYPNALNQTNKKGSTGLHVCGYLKRWDLALCLLKEGADPTIRNHEGHTFFLTATKDSQAPIAELFKDWPGLLKKHEMFKKKRGNNQEDTRPQKLMRFNQDKLKDKATKKLWTQECVIEPKTINPVGQTKEKTQWIGQEMRIKKEEPCSKEDQALILNWSRERQEAWLKYLLENKIWKEIQQLALAGVTYSHQFIEDCEWNNQIELADFLWDMKSIKKSQFHRHEKKGMNKYHQEKEKPFRSQKQSSEKMFIAKMQKEVNENCDSMLPKGVKNETVVITKKIRKINRLDL